MAEYEVKWTVKLRYTRVIEADSKREAVEISYAMGDAGVELDCTGGEYGNGYQYDVSQMKATRSRW
ncbi:hypothetical protein CMI37_25735 [Candidatus Pacearchaeota archaeon]|nr:hypothetical protein [Candidatus Pacearchaeota archaeon]